jgi:hypothetical protein
MKVLVRGRDQKLLEAVSDHLKRKGATVFVSRNDAYTFPNDTHFIVHVSKDAKNPAGITQIKYWSKQSKYQYESVPNLFPEERGEMLAIEIAKHLEQAWTGRNYAPVIIPAKNI